ncbi:MAG: PGPGW domain-containing protein [Thermoanaerobaculaceae bacterium]|jgi:uncharacterized membrane protein YbaN (DUF454 family)|nr:PGPGW domain-containing protein [Thermoanaerobaculaceae bacterium]
MKSVLRHVAGWGFLFLGVAGLFLPVLQGWLFIGLGALLLSPDVLFFRRLLEWIERRSPMLKRAIRTLQKKLRLHH